MPPAPPPERMAPETLSEDRWATPIGVMIVVWDAEARLRMLDWEDCEARWLRLLRLGYGSAPPVRETAPAAIRQTLDAYFAGEPDALNGLSCAARGTPFQQSVWRALREIPTGRTESYGGLAARIGRPSAVRAVGLANGSNPIGLVAPCHRVIGANGSLTGYAGGLARKAWLLRHEGVALVG